MVKKFIAAFLCLTMASPCFAAGRYNKHYPYQTHRHNDVHYHIEQRYDYHNDIHRHRKVCRTSQRTKTLAAVAGVAGLAMFISAVVD